MTGAHGTLELRITLRCLADLGLAPEVAEVVVAELAKGDGASVELLQAFVEKRGTSPIGDEADRMSRLQTGRIPIYILRRGKRYRGLTWHDEKRNVVWLVAAHLTHRSGEASDSYVYFRSLAAEQLVPVEADIRIFRRQQASAETDAIFDVLDPAIDEAISSAGRVVSVMVGPVPVAVACTRQLPPPHIKLAISMRWAEQPDPPPDAVVAIVTRVYRREFDGWNDLPYAEAGSTIGDRATGNAWVFESYVSGR